MMWSERQRALLRAIGVRVWQPAAAPGAAGLDTAPTVAEVPAATVVEAAPPPAAAVPTLPATSAGLDWPALRAAVAACRACGLCESRTQTVFGVGHASAHWMIV